MIMEKISLHYQTDRIKRHEFIINQIGEGKPLKGFLVDKGHKNGKEIHIVTTTGIIKIYNANTKILITELIARPNQINKLYHSRNLSAPPELLNIARIHQLNNYNEI